MTDEIRVADEVARIRAFEDADVGRVVASFAHHGWHKPTETFEHYLDEHRHGTRECYLAEVGDAVAGYCTLLWTSPYEPFRVEEVPEIADLNVLPPFRAHGIGSALLDTVEAVAADRSPVVGLGVGLYADYGAAQRLYVRRGYLPDGRGVMYDYAAVEPGRSVPIDDGATLMMTRVLTKRPGRVEHLSNDRQSGAVPVSISFRPTQDDERILREAAQPGESTSDTLRRARRLLDHERWLMQFRADAETLVDEDIDAEPETW